MSNYEGKDNYGRPKQSYLDKISEFNDEQLHSEVYDMVYQSALCANNPRADWHWMVGACYDECEKRDGNIYKSAYDECYKDHCG